MQSIVGRAQRRNRCRRGAASVGGMYVSMRRNDVEKRMRMNLTQASWPLCISTYVRVDYMYACGKKC